MSKINRDIWNAVPIKPAPMLASLRETVIARSDKRSPKWRFRLASDLVVSIQPRLSARTFHKFECRAVTCDGANENMLADGARQYLKGTALTYLMLGFDLTADASDSPRWELKAKSIGWGKPRPDESETFAMRDRLAHAFEEGRFDRLTPAIMLGRHCLYCGKALTDPVSQARMIGPECAGTSSPTIPHLYDLPMTETRQILHTTENNTMNAYLIDATTQTISAVQYAGFRELQALVGGGIELAKMWPDGTTLYVDDNGLGKPSYAGFLIVGSPYPLCSNGVVVGPEVQDDEQDEVKTLDPSITLDQLRSEVTFMAEDQVKTWALAHANEPAVVINGDVISRVGEIYGPRD